MAGSSLKVDKTGILGLLKLKRKYYWAKKPVKSKNAASVSG